MRDQITSDGVSTLEENWHILSANLGCGAEETASQSLDDIFMYHYGTQCGGVVMATEFFPTIVVNPATGSLFRQSRGRAFHGMQQYRKVKRLVPGIWWSYGDAFHDYPNIYKKYPSTDLDKPSAD